MAKSTQDWLQAHHLPFISKEEWPPYSPDLNPLDFCLWSILKKVVWKKWLEMLEGLIDFV